MAQNKGKQQALSEAAMPAQASVAPSLSPAQALMTHCPYRRATDLLQRLAPGKMRVGFFLGAGCPLSIRVPHGESSKPLIPEIQGLTSLIQDEVKTSETLRPIAEQAWERVRSRGITSPTIEDILGHLRTLHSLAGKNPVDGFTSEQLMTLDRAICNAVKQVVNTELPAPDTPYHMVAAWIQAIARDKPVEIFTTNYDLLIEQALEEQRVPYFDGFVGSASAFLDLEAMTLDDLPPRWARLWKLHGSINWWMTDKKTIRRSREPVNGSVEQLLIYPSHLKYDQSRQMPYLAMLDRLRVFLRSDQCVLLFCGYSFGDDHINAYVRHGLAGNPNASCVAMIYGDLNSAPKAVELARRYANLSLLACDGAIVGTVERNWHSESRDTGQLAQSAICTDPLPGRSLAADGQNKWLLGDFAALGKFLTQQLTSRDITTGGNDGY